MRRGPPPAAILLVLLVGGISIAFLVARAKNQGAPTPGGPDPVAPRAEPSPLVRLAPRLRGLRTGGSDLADAEIVARSLVDRALEGAAEPPRATVLSALAHEDWAVRWAGALAVTRYGAPDDELLRALAALLLAEESWVRRAGALAAGYFVEARSDELDGALERAARDEDAGVRAAAVRTLARRAARHIERVPLFREALADPEADVRGAAAYGIAQIELQERLPAEAQDALVRPLRQALSDDSSEVRMYAAMALGRLGSRGVSAADALLALLDDEHALVQSQAATALGSMGPAALPALEQALAADRGQRAALLTWALRLIGAAARPVLERALDHGHGLVRVHAAMKLWDLGRNADAVLPVLVAALRSHNPDVVLQSVRGLGRLGSAAAAAVPALEALTSDESEVLRRAAAGALTLIRPGPGGK